MKYLTSIVIGYSFVLEFMTKWYNFGISVEDEEASSELVEELKSLELNVYSQRDSVVKATENARRIDRSDVMDAIRSYSQVVEAVVVVNANDTSDTASGKAYEFTESGKMEQVRSDHSGSESTRRNWHGISRSGVRVTGGKYY